MALRTTWAFCTLSQDDIVGNFPPRSNTPIIEAHRPTCKDFITHAHLIILRLLAHLDAHLSLATGTLASFSPLDKLSGTSLRLLKALLSGVGARARTDLVGHTDMGSITMLLNIVGGLQIVPPNVSDPPVDSDWRYIRPVPDCALIKLGDVMVQWTGGVVRSNMHRLRQLPGRKWVSKDIAWLIW
ncbi:MAG: hypothetical protein Q9170_006755 [Blastenia crenularia]